ncbi:MAG: HIG1 domain-containing protein [Alphaproteobacteria bacterium]|nr:HIG1 domain-containing protein [Alphaproteobacteria bacterium]
MAISSWIVVGLMAATLTVLVVGVIFMAIGGKLDRKYSNKLMVMRVVLQGLALFAIAMLFFMAKH